METVLLADMNSFYASVEQADNRSLQGKPVIICGDPAKRHGITLAASREAKKYGIKTGMPCHQALSLCPNAVVVNPRMGRYLEVSMEIVEIANKFSPLVEPFSIDELFIDTKGTEKIFGSSVEVAHQFREHIQHFVGVPCSIGIAPNKLLAKVCCDVAAKKAASGIAVWSWNDVPEKLWPLPVTDLFGVGSRMGKRFKNMGITAIGTLAQYPVDLLIKKFGILGEVYHLSANGIDNSPVTPDSYGGMKGIGHSITLPRDYYAWSETQVVLREITEEVCSRARRNGKAAKTISVYVRGIDLVSSEHHSKSLTSYSNLATDIYPMVEWLFKKHLGNEPARTIGITLSNLIEDKVLQLDAFHDRMKERALSYTVDNIRNRYGKTAIFKASSLERGGLYVERSSLIGGHKA